MEGNSWITYPYQVYYNMKRDFYLDVYTILNQIQLTIWTICAFQVLNPHKWSLAKESSLKIEKWIFQKCQIKIKSKGMV